MGGVLLGLGLLATLRVTAEGACPTAAAVEARLQPLLPQLQDVPPARAHLEPLDELLRVEVRSEDGALLTVRDLQRAAPCADLAAAAAVVIASALLSAPRTPALPQLSLVPSPPPRARPLPPPVRRPLPQLDAGVGLTAAAAGAGLAVGAALVVHAAPSGRAWGFRLGLAGTALRREALGEAGAVWTRAQLELGPRYRVRPGRLIIDVHAHAAAALVYVSGQGFAADYASLGWDAGLGAGVRIGLPLRWAMPWLGVSATGYLRPQELQVVGQTESGALPRFDAVLGLGLSAGKWR